MKSGFVAIVGEPNAGKSTLLNRWVGEHLAIVSPKAQTTRQAIRGIVNRPDAQAIFVDTPGFHQSDKAFNQYMIDKVKESIKDADVCCLVTEPATQRSTLNQELLEYAKAKRKPVVIACNKTDLVSAHDEAEAARGGAEGLSPSRAPVPKLAVRYGDPCERGDHPSATGPLAAYVRGVSADLPQYNISALNGDGCDALLDELIQLLPEGPALFPEDIYTEHSMRFLASELIREVLLEKLHQELPYAAAVVIDEFKEKPTITVIKAAIVIEKDSQKSMVIGNRGTMIKEIGMEARKRIEKLVDQKVFLELFVRVEKNWTKDPKKVEEMGYE